MIAFIIQALKISENLSLKTKMQFQITVKMTIALAAACMILFSPAQAEEICVVTSKHLAHLGNLTNEFFQIIEETTNLVEDAWLIRRNKREYNPSEFLDFIEPIVDSVIQNKLVYNSAQYEIAGLLSSVDGFDYAINVPFLCDGETFDSSSIKYPISTYEDHFQLSLVFLSFYMDEYY